MPAQLSTDIGDLFPAGVVAATMREEGDLGELLPEEQRHLGRAVPRRQREFAAGRQCARRALAEFGISDFALEVAADRQPVWPQLIIGSITHTQGFCAAVAARRGELVALGIDTEQAGRVHAELWPRICGPEMDWLHGLPESDRTLAATLIFCAKEAFYKCQYTLFGEWLGFEDARVELNWSRAAPRFLVYPLRPIQAAERLHFPLAGRYLVHEGFVTAAIAA
jgi:4'-phosphopantetheinyl transferase EntD